MFCPNSCQALLWCVLVHATETAVMRGNSVFVEKCLFQSSECEKWRHASCQWGEGGSRIKRWWHGHTQTQINTPPEAYGTQPHIRSCHPIGSDQFLFFVFFFWKRDHIGGQLLCSTSAQWWHHSVWDRAIFSFRQRAVAAASPSSMQGLAETEALGEWWRISIS